MNPLVFFSTECHAALDQNPGLGFKSLPAHAIGPERYLYSVCPQRQFNTLPSPFTQSGCPVKLLPKSLHAKHGGSCTILIMVFVMTQLGGGGGRKSETDMF